MEFVSGAVIDGLEGRLAGVCGVLNVAHASLVDLVAESLDRGVWQQHGIRSAQHWVSWKTGLSAGRAKQIGMARRKGELPVTFTAMANGELSVDQVHVVAAHVPSEFDAQACGLAKEAMVIPLGSVLRRYVHDAGVSKPGADPKPAPTMRETRVERLHAWFDDDGMYRLDGCLSPERGAFVDQALQEGSRPAVRRGQHGRRRWRQG